MPNDIDPKQAAEALISGMERIHTERLRLQDGCTPGIMSDRERNAYHRELGRFVDSMMAGPAQAQRRFEKRLGTFGALVWNWIQAHCEEFIHDEWSDDILPYAKQAGLCHYVEYNPALHGDQMTGYPEPGDPIWYWEEEN